jgi:hypothetical protein
MKENIINGKKKF